MIGEKPRHKVAGAPAAHPRRHLIVLQYRAEERGIVAAIAQEPMFRQKRMVQRVIPPELPHRPQHQGHVAQFQFVQARLAEPHLITMGLKGVHYDALHDHATLAHLLWQPVKERLLYARISDDALMSVIFKGWFQITHVFYPKNASPTSGRSRSATAHLIR